jgi:hypothetical protein
MPALVASIRDFTIRSGGTLRKRIKIKSTRLISTPENMAEIHNPIGMILRKSHRPIMIAAMVIIKLTGISIRVS